FRVPPRFDARWPCARPTAGQTEPTKARLEARPLAAATRHHGRRAPGRERPQTEVQERPTRTPSTSEATLRSLDGKSDTTLPARESRTERASSCSREHERRRLIRAFSVP